MPTIVCLSKIAHNSCAIETAQIPRLRGTYIYIYIVTLVFVPCVNLSIYSWFFYSISDDDDCLSNSDSTKVRPSRGL